MTRPSRRQLLSGTAAAVPAVLAGCVTEARSTVEPDDEDGGSGDGRDSADDRDAPSESGDDAGDEHDDGDGGDSGDTDEDGIEETSTSAESIAVSIETVDTGCGGPHDERVAAEHEDGTVVVTGSLIAPTPCFEAIVTECGYDDGCLSLQIDVASTLEDGGVCVECLGTASYEATAGLPDDAEPETVIVDHVTGDEHVVELG